MTISTNKEKPAFVLVPGAAQNPAHYAHLLHLLQPAGYGATAGLLPSIGAQGEVTAADNADYVRNRLILPILDLANQDVILIRKYSLMVFNLLRILYKIYLPLSALWRLSDI
ncbi:hypothetical protein BDV39DRAFT_205335 [Aspergillus sergii]|uniref:Uncharacterized protein n=1 Tax=Aspergillus sergii TaxID=1034303 RepID=A0A5N6X2S5_9EURO|nr:hypothetical protein BDV39DRAFT_205335 [Aspergillus sergii]